MWEAKVFPGAFCVEVDPHACKSYFGILLCFEMTIQDIRSNDGFQSKPTLKHFAMNFQINSCSFTLSIHVRWSPSVGYFFSASNQFLWKEIHLKRNAVTASNVSGYWWSDRRIRIRLTAPSEDFLVYTAWRLALHQVTRVHEIWRSHEVNSSKKAFSNTYHKTDSEIGKPSMHSSCCLLISHVAALKMYIFSDCIDLEINEF